MSGGDEERSLVAENVGTEQPAGLGVGVELADTAAILQRPAVGDIAIFLEGLDVGPPHEILNIGRHPGICGSVNTAAGTQWCDNGRRSSA